MPFEKASAAWVARCIRGVEDQVVLKVGFPHMEAEQEIDGLLYWDSDPTVGVVEYDRRCNAMLLEDCKPGITLGEQPQFEQDQVVAKLLRRLWRVPSPGHPFRSLQIMIESWIDEAQGQSQMWPDERLAQQGLRVYRELIGSGDHNVLLATDLHAGNVLRAQRQPWLVIDPKPFVGDVCYDVTQHLLNCRERLRSDPMQLIVRVAELVQVDAERVRAWTFARLATQSGDRVENQAIARTILV
jgi:streptomycin 6-kinase